MKTHQIFRSHLQDAATELNVCYGEFLRKRGVNDFLMDASTQQNSPQQLALRALEDLLEPGSKGSMNRVVCLAVVSFLDACCDSSPNTSDDRSQGLKDLARLIADSAHSTEYKRWIKARYGQ